MAGYWIAVASAEHVRRGRAEGFMQVCHGGAAPLRRIKAGDGIVYYSPTISFRGQDRLQAFTALGIIAEGGPYRVDMGEGFHPYRRDVAWAAADEVPIHPLLDALEFTTGNPNWGYRLRLGLVPIGGPDFHLIERDMRAEFRGSA